MPRFQKSKKLKILNRFKIFLSRLFKNFCHEWKKRKIFSLSRFVLRERKRKNEAKLDKPSIFPSRAKSATFKRDVLKRKKLARPSQFPGMRRAPCPVRPEPPAGQAGNETGRDRWKPRPRLPCKAGGAMFGHLLSAAHRARTRFVGECLADGKKLENFVLSRLSIFVLCQNGELMGSWMRLLWVWVCVWGNGGGRWLLTFSLSLLLFIQFSLLVSFSCLSAQAYIRSTRSENVFLRLSIHLFVMSDSCLLFASPLTHTSTF